MVLVSCENSIILKTLQIVKNIDIYSLKLNPSSNYYALSPRALKLHNLLLKVFIGAFVLSRLSDVQAFSFFEPARVTKSPIHTVDYGPAHPGKREKKMQTTSKLSSIDLGRLKAAILLLLVLQILMFFCSAPGETAGWSATGPLALDRDWHTATLLSNGQVLAVGGYKSNSGYIANAELYDPADGAWSNASPLNTNRGTHTATLLGNGKVLVAGGYNGSYLDSAELYDPAAGSWGDAGQFVTGRGQHTATLLGNGKVLVAGGYNGSYLDSAVLYDPATNSWSDAGSFTTGRYGHTATLLPNGKVLVTGGYNGSYLSSAALYDPITNSWNPAKPLTTGGRRGHTATLLGNGKVLISGGRNAGGSLASAELYDPDTGNWSPCHLFRHSPQQSHGHPAGNQGPGGGGLWRFLSGQR